MIVVYLLLALACLPGLSLRRPGEDYLSRKTTTAVKGIFVPMVFFSHFGSYAVMKGNWADVLFKSVNRRIGQLMVVMFLFYSGYGIMRRLMWDREGYLRDFPRKRLFITWLRFALCVAAFIFLDLILGTLREYRPREILLAFTGWTSVGNSNWFMFVILALYILVYCVFRLLRQDLRACLIVFSVCAAGLTLLLSLGRESWWWNTLLTFPLGMWYGFLREEIDKRLLTGKRCPPALFVMAPLTAALYWGQTVTGGGSVVYILCAMAFALLVVTVTVLLHVGNRVLTFFGTHVFSFYMLQRLPMIAFRGRLPNIYLYFALCFAVTLALAAGFDYAFPRILSAFASGADRGKPGA